MARFVPRETLHQRVWFTSAVRDSLTEDEAAEVAEYLLEHRATTALWDAQHPMRAPTRYRRLFRRSLRPD